MKKFISGLMSACVAISSAIALTTSSAFNPNKDPNGDGSLTLADSTAILQYLGGHYEPSDLTELDMDDNDVVSVVDSNYVKMYDAGIINTSIEDAAEPMAENSTTSRTYVVYDAQTGLIDRNYSLQVLGSNTSNNTRSIIDPSTQDEDWSNRGVAKILYITDENEIKHMGTGFVVGPHTIATAAHVVFNKPTNTGYKLHEILLFDEDELPHSFTPIESHIPLHYKTTDVREYDYALITVEEDLSDYISFNLGAVTDNAATNSLSIKVVGFPIYYNYLSSDREPINTESSHIEMLTEGDLTTFNVNNIIKYTAYTSPGYSGSPIYTTETLNGTTYNTVIGVHIAAGNIGVKFTSHVLKFLKSNPNIQY